MDLLCVAVLFSILPAGFQATTTPISTLPATNKVVAFLNPADPTSVATNFVLALLGIAIGVLPMIWGARKCMKRRRIAKEKNARLLQSLEKGNFFANPVTGEFTLCTPHSMFMCSDDFFKDKVQPILKNGSMYTLSIAVEGLLLPSVHASEASLSHNRKLVGDLTISKLQFIPICFWNDQRDFDIAVGLMDELIEVLISAQNPLPHACFCHLARPLKATKFFKSLGINRIAEDILMSSFPLQEVAGMMHLLMEHAKVKANSHNPYAECVFMPMDDICSPRLLTKSFGDPIFRGMVLTNGAVIHSYVPATSLIAAEPIQSWFQLQVAFNMTGKDHPDDHPDCPVCDTFKLSSGILSFFSATDTMQEWYRDFCAYATSPTKIQYEAMSDDQEDDKNAKKAIADINTALVHGMAVVSQSDRISKSVRNPNTSYLTQNFLFFPEGHEKMIVVPQLMYIDAEGFADMVFYLAQKLAAQHLDVSSLTMKMISEHLFALGKAEKHYLKQQSRARKGKKIDKSAIMALRDGIDNLAIIMP